MKKWIGLVAVFAIVTALLSGCGPKRDPHVQAGGIERKPDKLVVWENADDGVQINNTKKLAAQFTKRTGIKVDVVAVPLLKQEDKLTLDGPAGKGPDLVTWPHDRLGEAIVKGLLQPIQVDDSVKEQFDDNAMRAMTYNGQVYGLPKVTESIALIYNKKLMNNVPATYEDLMKYAKENNKPAENKYGIMFEANNLYYTYFLFAAKGGSVFGETGGKTDPDKIELNSPGSIAGMKEVEKWFSQGLLPKGLKGDTVSGLFKEGNVAAVLNGPWAVKDYQAAGIDLGVAPLPKVDGKPARTFVGVKGWYLSAYSKHPRYATDLMKFLTSREALKSRFLETGEIPPRKDLLNDPMIKNNPLINGFAEQAKTGVPMPSIPEMGVVWEPVNNAHTFVAEGKQTPKQALDDAVRLIKENIKTMKQ
ncbi:maltodextrin ABC transporter substrate-binding protein [Thermoactinomyces sp. CICC 10521]|jgi:arabinogalactan oligomer/maltooligosaccharide transport system substrate-binding protein|uniref:maltodextrin ABC transporter substrate-binding protein n=1 Tax=Thermoactinomyces sp. CICC 10521 TaxID=2767426 RepID=UPI0018DB1BBB|nr:maltodextrin ABC transporter substrate-binding protein [Thermoactinomyces sp. CICC 10521]MBH8607154.1 extracellular solute-binding protein [Thermoactinomyces sp. CICC 10521]